MPTVPVDTVVRVADLLIDTRFGSPSMVQRRLRLTYATTRAVFALLVEHGVLAATEGTLAHEVLVDPDDKTAVLAQLRERLA